MPSGASWPPCTGRGACRPRMPTRSPASSPPTSAWPWTPTPAWSSASTRTRRDRPDRRGRCRSLPSRVGALLPLLPWFFAGGTGALVASVIIGAVAALILGGVIGALTERGVVRTAFRQLAVVAVAAGVTYAVGSLLGVSTS